MEHQNTITLRELKDIINGLIEDYGDGILDTPIYASCDYGDISHTQQLVNLTGNVVLSVPNTSAYSQTGFSVPSDDEEREPSAEAEQEVLMFVN